MNKPKKKEMLAKYKERKPKRFVQYDGFAGVGLGDPSPDANGDGLWSTETYELMHGSTVRILIDPEASKETVLRLLCKIRDWIVQDGVYRPVATSQLRQPDIGVLEAEGAFADDSAPLF